MPRFLFSWTLIALLCAGTLAGCKPGRSRPEPAVRSEDPFKGEPKLTADVHYLSGQLMESKATTPGTNGKLPPAREIDRLHAAALNQYAAALELDPRHTPSMHRSAALLTQMKQHDRAIAMWQRYVEATGRTPASLVNLGLANELAGRPAAAEEAYREATRRDPSHKAAHVNLGLLLAKQGQLQPAKAALSAVLEPPAVHWHLGVALQAAGREAEADQQFRAAAALDPAYAKRPERPGASAKVE